MTPEEIAEHIMKAFGIVDLDSFGSLTMRKLRSMLASAARTAMIEAQADD